RRWRRWWRSPTSYSQVVECISNIGSVSRTIRHPLLHVRGNVREKENVGRFTDFNKGTRRKPCGLSPYPVCIKPGLYLSKFFITLRIISCFCFLPQFSK